MGLETATFVDALVTSNPDGSTDQRSTADDHLRLIKAALKRTFPMFAAAVSASAQAVTYVNDLTSPVQAQINALREGSATANNAVNARYANSASFASLAAVAALANFATTAGTATSAGAATAALFSNSASFATFAGTATVAGSATNAAQLNGVAAAGYAQLAVSQSFTKGQAITQASSSGTSLTPNCDTTTMFRHILTGTTTIGNPTSPRSGMVITLHLLQDAVGGRTISSWGSAFKFASGTDPTLSTAPNAVDVFAFQYDSVSAAWRSSGFNVS